MSILNPLFEAVAWVISRIHDALAVPFGADSGWSWGLSIVLLVCLMRLVMVPLFVKQVKSQRKMQAHMPALQEIRKKYKSDKTRLNEETMKFYKENGINPLGGCLPLVAQLPVFWSLFNVLKAIADWTPMTNGHVNVPQYGLSVATVRERASRARLRRAAVRQVPVGGHRRVVDGARGDPALGGVSATTTFLTMRQSAKRGMMNQQMPDPDQPGAAMAQSMSKNMMYIAPFFALTGLYWQYGLVIYWVTTNVLDAGAAAHPVPQPADRGERDRRLGDVACGRSDRTAVQEQPGGGRRQEQRFRQDGDQARRRDQARGTTGQARHHRARTGRRPSLPRRAQTAPRARRRSRPRRSSASGTPAKSTANAAANSGMVSTSKSGNGGRGLLGFGKGKQEPEPAPAVPETKVVRQQPVRQARSKRSGRLW